MHELFKNGFFTGINYWGSKSAINMWSEYDEESIERDFSLLREVGITHLRVFPLWPVFQPLTALYGPGDVFEYGFGENSLPDTEAGRAGVSEEACEKFRSFCSLADKYGMKLIVGLITGHMSYRTYAPPAFLGKALLSDPTVIKWQRRFVKYFVSRFKNQPSIVGWDLGNETKNMPGLASSPDSYYLWASVICDAIRTSDPTRPVVSGLDGFSIENGSVNLKTIAELCDIHTVHPYNIFSTPSSPITSPVPLLDIAYKCRICEDIGGVPTFAQEFGAIGYMNCSKKTEADFYRASLFTTLAHGGHGVMWWCAFDQGHHDFAPYRWNNIGSNYGFFDKDLAPKPIVEVNKSFKKLLSKLPSGELPPSKCDGFILLPREESSVIELGRVSFILASEAGLDMHFSYMLDPIPDSPLYIIPSVEKNKAIPKGRLQELLKKVSEGSTLYLNADTGFFRDIPDITGVEIAYREAVNSSKTLFAFGEKLPISTTFFYKPETVNAQIVGTDENGEGVFFKHSYGKGYIYFLTLPLERSLVKNPSIFHRKDAPKYSTVYKEIAKCAGVKKAVTVSDRFVGVTEHEYENGERYICLVNYHNEPTDFTLEFDREYSLDAVWGDLPSGGKMHLEANDGAIFKIK
jgi:endo-1,4-beta-mannosidase